MTAELSPTRSQVVETQDQTQVRPFAAHMELAASLEPSVETGLRRLASQLQHKPVIPLLGAGASYDCGMRLAGDISQDLCAAYRRDPAFAPHESIGDDRNLGLVAEAIANSRDQAHAVRSVRLHEAAAWPNAEAIDDHFCGYRVLARMAREDFISSTVGFNYDCCAEAGLDAEGFLRSASTSAGQQWADHARVIPDAASYHALVPPGPFTMYKAHGCADNFRRQAMHDEAAAAKSIVLLASQLRNWRKDSWIRDQFRQVVRTNVLMLIGFSGQDPVIAGEIQATLEDVYETSEDTDDPRVVAIDFDPHTPALGSLIKAGLGGRIAGPGLVTRVDTHAASTTAALIVLLAEMLLLRLTPDFLEHDYELPPSRSGVLAALLVTAPTMLRWSYLLGGRTENGFVQRINLQQAAQRGYVPLTADPDRTARLLRTHAEMAERTRGARGGAGAMSGYHGWLMSPDGSRAYMPVGLGHDALKAAIGPGRPATVAALPRPSVDCLLVSDDDGELNAFVLDTGERGELR